MYIYNLYLLSFILMLYRAPVDTSPVTEGVTLFKHQLLLKQMIMGMLIFEEDRNYVSTSPKLTCDM